MSLFREHRAQLERIAQTAAATRIDAAASVAPGGAGSVEQLVERLAAANATLEATLAATREQHAAALAALQTELDAVRAAHEAAAEQARRQLHDAQAALLQSRSWLLAVRTIRHARCGVISRAQRGGPARWACRATQAERVAEFKLHDDFVTETVQRLILELNVGAVVNAGTPSAPSVVFVAHTIGGSAVGPRAREPVRGH